MSWFQAPVPLLPGTHLLENYREVLGKGDKLPARSVVYVGPVRVERDHVEHSPAHTD